MLLPLAVLVCGQGEQDLSKQMTSHKYINADGAR